MAADFTYADARGAMDRVLLAYGDFVDPALKAQTVYTVFQFCDPERYRLLFTQAYTRVFQKANAALIPFVITHEHCPAFVMPDLGSQVGSRRIFVANRSCKAGKNTTMGTLYHEYIHFLSHKSFYPDYYNSGDLMAPFVVEGATEYLTREVNHADVLARHGKNYQNNYTKTKRWVDSALGNRERLLKHVLQGTACDLSSIRP